MFVALVGKLHGDGAKKLGLNGVGAPSVSVVGSVTVSSSYAVFADFEGSGPGELLASAFGPQGGAVAW